MNIFQNSLKTINQFSILFVSLFLTLLFSTLLLSCDNNSDKINENLINTYKEIIIARETYKDVNEANLEVAKILKNHNLSEEEFRKQLFETMVKNKNFTKFIDSVKSKVLLDLK